MTDKRGIYLTRWDQNEARWKLHKLVLGRKREEDLLTGGHQGCVWCTKNAHAAIYILLIIVIGICTSVHHAVRHRARASIDLSLFSQFLHQFFSAIQSY